ncbi:hypothetical protein [Microbacterium sp. LWS13-1.2]|uniref:hypothetical protein n=1 Tax=Microbacterium sp. LWS13-1.2 TaxID=3135264 RepID=UPI0032DBEA1B
MARRRDCDRGPASQTIGNSHGEVRPADRLGGIAAIAALAAPFSDMSFVPSGGVSAGNMSEYLAHGSVPAVSGSWMVARKLVVDRKFDRIEALSREAMSLSGADRNDG